jgi:prevent-host-death family protein
MKMDISVTKFKARCLALIRKVEKGSESVVIKRRGKPVARLTSTPKPHEAHLKPWERLRAQMAGTVCLFEPDESVLRKKDFEAMR